MPSVFEQRFTQSLDALYAVFGLSATYNAIDGSAPVACTVRVHRNEAHQVDSSTRVTGELRTGEIMVRQSEIAKPVKGGRFTVEQVEVWSIVNTPLLKNGQFQCTVERVGKDRMMEKREQ